LGVTSFRGPWGVFPRWVQHKPRRAFALSGLLHDVLDDSMMTEEQLQRVVPVGVVKMVRNISRMSEACEVRGTPPSRFYGGRLFHCTSEVRILFYDCQIGTRYLILRAK
jgi:hypothetical protein